MSQQADLKNPNENYVLPGQSNNLDQYFTRKQINV